MTMRSCSLQYTGGSLGTAFLGSVTIRAMSYKKARDQKSSFFSFSSGCSTCSGRRGSSGHQLQRSEEVSILSPASPSPMLRQVCPTTSTPGAASNELGVGNWLFFWVRDLIRDFLAGEVTRSCSAVAMGWSVINQPNVFTAIFPARNKEGDR